MNVFIFVMHFYQFYEEKIQIKDNKKKTFGFVVCQHINQDSIHKMESNVLIYIVMMNSKLFIIVD